jgi:hypothetical protein
MTWKTRLRASSKSKENLLSSSSLLFSNIGLELCGISWVFAFDGDGKNVKLVWQTLYFVLIFFQIAYEGSKIWSNANVPQGHLDSWTPNTGSWSSSSLRVAQWWSRCLVSAKGKRRGFTRMEITCFTKHIG